MIAEAKELARVAKMLSAGSFFSSRARAAIGAHAELVEAVSEIENHIHYRTHGQGWKDDISGDQILTPDEMRKAQMIEGYVRRIKSSAEALFKDLRELRGHAESLDDFMRMN